MLTRSPESPEFSHREVVFGLMADKQRKEVMVLAALLGFQASIKIFPLVTRQENRGDPGRMTAFRPEWLIHF